MTPQDFEAFAEDMLHRYGANSVFEALKRMRTCRAAGDHRNAEVWMAITNRVREMLDREPLPEGSMP